MNQGTQQMVACRVNRPRLAPQKLVSRVFLKEEASTLENIEVDLNHSEKCKVILI